ncbi:MAG: hypothetical protein K2W96_16780 [Gemmataceae bacterium]|nr:hypothetical protein [Gemmataceae bacterium]
MPVVMLGVFALTLFLSASLLFLVEPMIGKMMLPLLGGTPAVWNTCMLFFQVVLLAGYAYAHWTTKHLGPRKQAVLHLGVLLLPLLFFLVNGPLTVNQSLIAGREANPVLALLVVLSVTVGVPMFVICTSAPVLQRWFAATDHPAARDPYFLYGASNLGSMLGLMGYPFFIEPAFTLAVQRHYWAWGYAGLVGLTALCAWFMWRSRPAASRAAAGTAPSTAVTPAKEGVAKAPAPSAAADLLDREAAPITWMRRLRWITLALVPSSLMLGATTYITTDIASMPFLWVLPLSLYLLTFIIVFAVFSPMTQNAFVAVGVWALAGFLGFWLTPQFFSSDSIIRMAIMLGSLAAIGWAFMIFSLRDKELIHHVMVMIMPLLVLLLLFLMLAEIGGTSIWAKIALHLATFFVVSMVCHGEMARDRPAPQHLTEFFLLMSVGGVLGGLFNALVAPMVFNSVIEYQMMMMVACLLVPALGASRDSLWARRADLALGTVFIGVGGLLLWMFWLEFDEMPSWKDLPLGHWGQALALLVPALAFGAAAAWQGWGTPPSEPGEKPQKHWADRVLDVALPLGLLVLVLGLYWGLPARGVRSRVASFAAVLGLETDQFRNILTFGLPAVLCYTFVERSVRFGLGVGAILLAAGMSQAIKEGAIYQDRSFFGVLKVEDGWSKYPEDGSFTARWPRDYFRVTRLVHGTTLHGKQFDEPALRNLPSSYYHSTGPVGQLMRAYNRDPKRGIAVIGLGTGTTAVYALRGQTLDYFDIDSVVVDIAFDTNRFFTYVEDAEDRGVDVNMVLGDARLTFDPSGSRPRMKPLRKRQGEPVPARKLHDRSLTGDMKYGLIFADAFSSDAIPVHLLTKEAVAIYLRRLLEDGVICVHISNRYLDLQPVLANIVEALRKEGVRDEKGELLEAVPDLVGYHMSDDDETAPGKSRSHWIAISRSKKHLEKLWHIPLWQEDEGGLSALGVALFPPLHHGLVAPTGMAYALHAVAHRVALKAAEEEKREGDHAIAPPKWEPLDTTEDMDARNEADVKEAARLEGIAAKLREERDARRKDYESAKEKFGTVKADHDPRAKRVSDLERLVKASPASEKAANQQRLDDARAAIKLSQKKYDEEKAKAATAEAQHDWAEARYDAVMRRLRPLAGYESRDKGRVKGRIEKLSARKEKNRRVGVWTDDYSNLWSVFDK